MHQTSFALKSFDFVAFVKSKGSIVTQCMKETGRYCIVPPCFNLLWHHISWLWIKIDDLYTAKDRTHFALPFCALEKGSLAGKMCSIPINDLQPISFHVFHGCISQNTSFTSILTGTQRFQSKRAVGQPGIQC